jgi:hypothetical protein
VTGHFRDRGPCVVANGLLIVLGEPGLDRLGTVA